ncbi:MAG TPA: 4-hydroxythreonine-4-phosphate dehydrogenase PdxA [Clostridia bacterium]
MNHLPVIGILLGDAAGVGPELVARLVANGFLTSLCRPVLIGDMRVLRKAANVAGVADSLPDIPVSDDPAALGRLIDDGAPLAMLDLGDIDPDTIPYGQLSESSGRSCLKMMDTGVSLCRSGLLRGFAFAPFNKTALMLGGSDQPSELEYMAHAFGLKGGYCEINVLDGLWTTRVTSHIPISEVSRSITVETILEAIELAHATVLRTGRVPRIGVAALNPHAGENGRCGREEIDVIAPAIAAARDRGMDATGPWPADTLFVRAFAGAFDAVVTMYHDQGQIALKIRGFERGAAVDGGLPYPITTCTHGTAFDIAGQGKAWTGALESAVRIVCEMASAGPA